MNRLRFRTWLHREMAEIPRPDGHGLVWSTMKKPPQWGWAKKGEKLLPAYTPEDPKLTDPNAVHSQGPNAPARPAAPPATTLRPPQPRQPVQPAGQGQQEYVLATAKRPLTMRQNVVVPKGHPIVAFRGGNGWTFRDKNGNEGSVPSDQIASHIESYKDDREQQVKGPDPKALFSIFDDAMHADPEWAEHIGYEFEDDGIEEEPTKPVATTRSGRPTPESVRLSPDKMTEYNRAIEDKFVNSPENIMIDALAGTGKTTMLKHLSSFIKPGEKWLYLVFNKKNQVESKQAFPDGVDVLTTHAFLGQILKKNGKAAGGNMELPPQGQKWRKIWKIADSTMAPDWPSPDSDLNYKNRKTGDWTSPFHYNGKEVTTKLAELCKSYAFNPQDPNIESQIVELIQKQGIDMDLSSGVLQDRDYTPDMIQMAIRLLQMSVPGAMGNSDMSQFRDQDDTLWFSALYANDINWNLGYKVVLMDEVQDFNQCQLVMAKKLRETGARVIGVGDPNQAMYLFRGADSAAFGKLKDIVGSGTSESLPINFRSGGNIIDWVTKNTHVNNLQAAPHMAGKGRVFANGGTDQPLKYEDFMGSVVNEWGQSKKLGESTCLISRTNAPLGHAALTLLKNNVNFQIIGKDLSKDLVELIKRVTFNKPESVNIEYFSEDLADFYGYLKGKWGSKIAKRDELKEIESYVEVLGSVLNYLADTGFQEQQNSRPMTTVKDFLIYLERKLSGLDPDNAEDAAAIKARDPKSCVMLTTAHKAKGLEWDRIFLMKPSAYNPQGEKIRTEEQAQQEMNAWYVAATRGKKTLMVSADDEP